VEESYRLPEAACASRTATEPLPRLVTNLMQRRQVWLAVHRICGSALKAILYDRPAMALVELFSGLLAAVFVDRLPKYAHLYQLKLLVTQSWLQLATSCHQDDACQATTCSLSVTWCSQLPVSVSHPVSNWLLTGSSVFHRGCQPTLLAK
jgi:hypothetical protein